MSDKDTEKAEAMTSEQWMKDAAKESYELFNGWIAALLRIEFDVIRAVDLKALISQVIDKHYHQHAASHVAPQQQCTERLNAASHKITELCIAGRELIDWMPVCSVGSSGYLCRVKLEKAIGATASGGSEDSKEVMPNDGPNAGTNKTSALEIRS